MKLLQWVFQECLSSCITVLLRVESHPSTVSGPCTLMEDAVQGARDHARLCACPGPPGALLRWLLADLNFAAPGAAAWFPFGTFAANLLACAVIFAMEVRALPNCMPIGAPAQRACAPKTIYCQ